MKSSGPGDIKSVIAELMENLGTVGLFMLGEARSFLRKTWGASREEFYAAVDQTARTMKQSGKTAAEDIERAAEKIKASWDLLNKEKNLEWDTFLTELKSRLEKAGSITRETFDLCVNQAKNALDKQWSSTGRVGEEHLKAIRQQTEQMAESFKHQWGVFRDQMQKASNKIDRAIEAAWEELKKK
ncbi:MAG TPA: hypothetical protein VMC85_02350 [Desulfomonilaceae bacterium]|nr:hypothetical protein [Desulfomonilaceae bacterium]